jgi:hypothetical protein
MRWIIIAAAACLVGGILFFLFRQEHPQDPDLRTLAATLRERTDAVLNAPGLSESTIEISVVKSQLGAEIDRVKYLATKLGGTAVAKGPVRGPITELIAEIPEENQKRFMDAVQDGIKDVPDPGMLSSGKILVVTIQIRSQG